MRLGLSERIRTVFETTEMLPAAGQGALGIEVRAGRDDVVKALSHLMDTKTWLVVSAERAVSRVMGGSCSMPLAAHATFSGDVLSIRAAWGDPEGVHSMALANDHSTVTDTAGAVHLGENVARQLQAAVQAVQAKS
jgi:hydroxymethylbilane synthase